MSCKKYFQYQFSVLRHTPWRGRGGYSLKTKSLQDVKYRRQIENKRKVDIFLDTSKKISIDS